ncbi:MAG: phytanoyl-CoA dioxygenase family protein [Candidatus Hydrogenedentes bacterium]|nr:phytanoyl-CoA dioxygenase family protein [Candidatus Hydrogenedentota bacterium]
MLTEAQVQDFRENGFIVGPRIYTDAEADELRERMFTVHHGKSQGSAEANRNLLGDGADRVVIQIVNIWEADDLFRKHVYNEKICALTAQLIGYPVLRVWHDQVQYKPPKVGGPTNWHQDHPYWPIIQPAELISAWTALDDATIENGCMWMVPGSHKWGPHKGGTIGTDDATFEPTPDLDALPNGIKIQRVPCEVKKGQVMFHHCLTWHGSPNNNSDRGRPAIAVHYMPGYTRFEPNGAHLMDKRVEVKPGEILQGKYFPTVWDNGPVAHCDS